MTQRRLIGASVLLVSVLLSASARAAEYETSVPPADGAKYKSAEFRLWLPDGVKHIRGVLVRQHGCGRKGLDHADDVQWRALAKKWDLALLGSHFQQNKDCSDWWEPGNGSERAFLAALQIFAAKSGHPELTRVPWAIWGHSGGALWAMSMAHRHPDRVLAVFARSQALTNVDARALQIPTVLNYGVREKQGRFVKVHENSSAALAKYRPQGALWAVAVDPKSEHDTRLSRHFAIPFFDAVFAQRLPAPGTQTIRPMDADRAWLGDPETLAIAPAGQYQGDRARAAWLSDEPTARAWQEYVKTGEVTDKTPPPAPTAARAVLVGGMVQLRWSADADLQSGLKEFRVYRDGKRVGTVGGTVTKANPKGHYQTWNYGDEPEPRPAAPRFDDPAGAAASVYEITAVNHAGLESAKTRVKVTTRR